MASLNMQFTVQKLQHDLVKYLEGNATALPYAVRVAGDHVYASYTVSTKESVSYVRLVARFTVSGVRVDLEHWGLGTPDAGAELLERVAEIKHRILCAMASHTVGVDTLLTHPLSRAVNAAARWVESWVSSAFQA